MCSRAFPDARAIDIGRTTLYNRQASVENVICFGYGRNLSADFNTDGVACGLLSAALGAGRVKTLELFADAADGACSGVAIAAQPKSPESYLEAACSWGG